MDTDFDDRFQKAVLDALGHQSAALAMLRTEWIEAHTPEDAKEEVENHE